MISSSAPSTRASPAARRSATRSSRWRCSSRRSRSSTRRTRASTSTRCASWPTASTSCARPSARCSSSRTTSGCSNYIVPDFVHVLVDGRIVRSGGKELALELEEKGYAWLEKEPPRRRRVAMMDAAVAESVFAPRLAAAAPASRPGSRNGASRAFERFERLGFPTPARRGVALHRRSAASPGPPGLRRGAASSSLHRAAAGSPGPIALRGRSRPPERALRPDRRGPRARRLRRAEHGAASRTRRRRDPAGNRRSPSRSRSCCAAPASSRPELSFAAAPRDRRRALRGLPRADASRTTAGTSRTP